MRLEPEIVQTPEHEEQLRALAGRIHSQQLDRTKPLWEVWLVQGLEENRFALISKTHHALVDGNKRLAWAATAVFLVINGRPPRVDQDAAFDLVMAVADGPLADVEAIAQRLVHLTD